MAGSPRLGTWWAGAGQELRLAAAAFGDPGWGGGGVQGKGTGRSRRWLLGKGRAGSAGAQHKGRSRLRAGKQEGEGREEALLASSSHFSSGPLWPALSGLGEEG